MTEVLKKARVAAVASGKKHMFTLHGIKRRVASTLTVVGGYYLGLGVLDTTTTMDAFFEMALRPYALIGLCLCILGPMATTGK